MKIPCESCGALHDAKAPSCPSCGWETDSGTPAARPPTESIASGRLPAPRRDDHAGLLQRAEARVIWGHPSREVIADLIDAGVERETAEGLVRRVRREIDNEVRVKSVGELVVGLLLFGPGLALVFQGFAGKLVAILLAFGGLVTMRALSRLIFGSGGRYETEV